MPEPRRPPDDHDAYEYDDEYEYDEDVEADDDPDGDDTVAVELDSTLAVYDPAAEALLAGGEVELVGRMPWSSNATFLVHVDDGTHRTQAVYKPERGERPLWDFPPGLWRREVATYEMARALGWELVPPTVRRDDAPLGVGSVQFFVPVDYDRHYFTFRDDPALRDQLHRLCLLDVVTNNTDRKGGHCLLAADGRVWGIDHGLNFHQEFKLRTVVWDWAGDRIPAPLAADLARLLDEGLPAAVATLLDPFERDAVLTRTRALLAAGRFPVDDTGHRYPWPLV